MDIQYLCFSGNKRDILKFLQDLYEDLIEIEYVYETYGITDGVRSNIFNCTFTENIVKHNVSAIKKRIEGLNEYNEDVVGSTYITILCEEDTFNDFYLEYTRKYKFII